MSGESFGLWATSCFEEVVLEILQRIGPCTTAELYVLCGKYVPPETAMSRYRVVKRSVERRCLKRHVPDEGVDDKQIESGRRSIVSEVLSHMARRNVVHGEKLNEREGKKVWSVRLKDA